MKLSDYCVLIKPYINNSLSEISQKGYTIGYNHKEYQSPVDFLDDSVISLVDYVMQGDVEKDVDFSEAMRLSGVIEGYLTNTGIMSRVVKDRNPLGFLKR